MLQAVAKTKESDESPMRLDAIQERARLNLEAWIEASGYSVTQVADLAGIPQASLGRYVNGKSPVPFEHMPALAEVFGRETIADFSDPTPTRPLTGEELLLKQPMFAKARPGLALSEEDRIEFKKYVAGVEARRAKKLKKK